jgi:hypothetical protein
MKRCLRCDVEKDEGEFGKKGKYLQAFCKVCSRAASAAWYVANKRHHVDNVVARNKSRTRELQELKRQLGCALCEEKEPVCIDFHHLDPTTKDERISVILNAGSQQAFESEIQKCVPLCSNCHRKVHAGLLAVDETMCVKLQCRCGVTVATIGSGPVAS